jgi:tRNA-Thr(GGU) m(6)t(6)A37 methyltransferase TsaA
MSPIFNYRPIGIIHTPFDSLEGMPIQPSGAGKVRGKIELFPEYIDGLQDMDGFSHIILLYHFHLSNGFSLKVVPFLDSRQRGLFSTRAPKRPNPIGFSVVKLISLYGSVINIENVDMADQTPLLDIKPYVPDFDCYRDAKTGWLETVSKTAKHKKSDRRFKT